MASQAGAHSAFDTSAHISHELAHSAAHGAADTTAHRNRPPNKHVGVQAGAGDLARHVAAQARNGPPNKDVGVQAQVHPRHVAVQAGAGLRVNPNLGASASTALDATLAEVERMADVVEGALRRGDAAGGNTLGGNTAGGTAWGLTRDNTAGSNTLPRGSTAGGNTAGGNTAGGNTAGGDTAWGIAWGLTRGNIVGGNIAGGNTAGGDTTRGDTTRGNTLGDDTAGGNTAGGNTARGDTAEGNTAGGNTAGGYTLRRGNTARVNTAGGDTAGGNTARVTILGEAAWVDTVGGEAAGSLSRWAAAPAPDTPPRRLSWAAGMAAARGFTGGAGESSDQDGGRSDSPGAWVANAWYVCMYVKIRQHQHTRVHAHTGPRRHARAPACHRHRIPRLVRRYKSIDALTAALAPKPGAPVLAAAVGIDWRAEARRDAAGVDELAARGRAVALQLEQRQRAVRGIVDAMAGASEAAVVRSVGLGFTSICTH